MERLKVNQVVYRVSKIKTAVDREIVGLDRRDQEDILQRLFSEFQHIYNPEGSVDSANEEDIAKLMKAAMVGGLKDNDPQMVRAAQQWMQEKAAGEYLSDLTINITPYVIADKSLARIVLEADDEVIEEIEAALQERRNPAASSEPASV